MATPRRRGLSLISMPYHAATPTVGMGRGPTALLDRHGLAEALGEDVAVEVIGAPDPRRPEIARTLELARRLAERVRAARLAGRLPLVVAGNCNSCLGTVAGLRPAELGVVWFAARRAGTRILAAGGSRARAHRPVRAGGVTVDDPACDPSGRMARSARSVAQALRRVAS